jgi:hypothetical protein
MANHCVDIAGQRFGSLVAIKQTKKTSSGNYYWFFACDCGNTVERVATKVCKSARDGRRVSCKSCRSKNKYVSQGDWISLDVSTKTHPNTWCAIDKTDLALIEKTGGRWVAARAHNGLLYITQKNGPYLHRLLMQPDEGMEVDHIDGDPLNNRKSNLRCVEPTINRRNTRLHSRNKTGATGVLEQNGRFAVLFCFDGKQKYCGVFDSFDDAVALRKSLEAQHGYHPNHGRIS